MEIATIGFTRSSAQSFFERIAASGIRRVGDVRVHLSDNTGEPYNTETQQVYDALRFTRLDDDGTEGEGEGEGEGEEGEGEEGEGEAGGEEGEGEGEGVEGEGEDGGEGEGAEGEGETAVEPRVLPPSTEARVWTMSPSGA